MNQISGVGVGLRAQYYADFLGETPPTVPWLEILADNYLGASGISWEKTKRIAKNYPVVLHCINCGVGNADPINWEYCQQIKSIADTLNPAWISDHLCWTAVNNHHSHSLLPLPFRKDIANQVADRISELQSFFGRPFLIENVTAYLRTEHDELNEAAFINYVAEMADCGILLDINNLYINGYNHNECTETFLQQINTDRVKQYHIAGHQTDENWKIDTHDQKINNAVMTLYKKALKIVGIRPTCIEWDEDIPSWLTIEDEINKVSRAIP